MRPFRLLLFWIPLLAGLLVASARAEEPTGRILVAGVGPEIAVVTCPRGPGAFTLRRATSAAWSIGESTLAPMMITTGAGRGIIIWSGPAGAVFGRFRLDGDRYRETFVGRWPKGWSPADAADLDGDGVVDLLLTRYDGDGDSKRFLYRVAPGTPDGGFGFEERAPVEVVSRCRGAFFLLGDVDRNGTCDLLFHSFPDGGAYRTQVMMLRGNGAGGFADLASAQLVLTSPHGATRPILADLVGGGHLDLFLPPDDDVADDGQCHFARNRGDGTFDAVQPSFDLRPESEGPGSDDFYGRVTPCDLDGDGQTDLLAQSLLMAEQQFRYRIYWGLGDGAFEPDGRLVEQGTWSERPSPGVLPIRRVQDAGRATPDEPILEFGPVWEDLGAEDPDRACAAVTRCLRAGATILAQVRPAVAKHAGDMSRHCALRVLAMLETLGNDEAGALIDAIAAGAVDPTIAKYALGARARMATGVEKR